MLKWDDWLKQQVRYSRPGRESWRSYAECRQRHEKYGERDIWGNMAKTKIKLIGILDGSIRKKVDRAIVEEKMAENFS